ncbi:MAG: hypothetical protein J0L92_23845 [Deltaproteobacteria bacterium]|nr:hypothetical protein [Deltaproteobacteria bacterium]
MTDPRDRSDVGALARARRFFGRVLETVRGGEPVVELVPDAQRDRSPLAAPAPRAETPIAAQPVETPRSVALVRVLDLEPLLDEAPEERVITLPEPTHVPSAEEPARALLADGSWSGLRHEARGGDTLLAWRDVDRSAHVLRTIEIRCAFGALDATPRVEVKDRPISSTIGAVTLASDAARWVVALGSLRDGAFVSVAHATLR